MLLGIESCLAGCKTSAHPSVISFFYGTGLERLRGQLCNQCRGVPQAMCTRQLLRLALVLAYFAFFWPSSGVFGEPWPMTSNLKVSPFPVGFYPGLAPLILGWGRWEAGAMKSTGPICLLTQLLKVVVEVTAASGQAMEMVQWQPCEQLCWASSSSVESLGKWPTEVLLFLALAPSSLCPLWFMLQAPVTEESDLALSAAPCLVPGCYVKLVIVTCRPWREFLGWF